MDIKVSGDLILASALGWSIGGHGVGQESKRVIWNVTKITRENIPYISKLFWKFELMLPPIIYRDCQIQYLSCKKGECIYTISIPVSKARREVLRIVEDTTVLPEKAGLAGANILCFIAALGVDFEDPALALSNSNVKFKSWHNIGC